MRYPAFSLTLCFLTCLILIAGIATLSQAANDAPKKEKKAAKPVALKSLMTIPGDTVFADDYQKPDLDKFQKMRSRKGTWLLKGGTRCAGEDGALKLWPPTQEVAAKNAKWSTGWTRAMIRQVPQDSVIGFRFMLLPVKGQKKPPRFFFENGHHKVRVNGGADGVSLVVFDKTKKDPKFKIKAGTWYQVLFEIRGDEVVVQFGKGPTLYYRDKKIAQERIGLQFGVISKGGILLDDLLIRKVNDKARPDWPKTRKRLENAKKEPESSKK